jgi:hypothetical protein
MMMISWFDIKWHFSWNWMIYAIIIGVVSGVAALWAWMPVQKPRPVIITPQASGVITSVRATGAWENWCKIELKFDDGTVLLASYGFVRKYNIREGRRYSVQYNSYYGRTATELKQ